MRSRRRTRSMEEGANSRASMSRKVANDAISKDGGNMGASVYIADEITVNISFNF